MAKRFKVFVCVLLCVSLAPYSAWAEGVVVGEPEPSADLSGASREDGSQVALPAPPSQPEGASPVESYPAEGEDNPSDPVVVEGANESMLEETENNHEEVSPLALNLGPAVEMSGLFTIVNLASGKALDISSGSRSNGANAQQYTENNSPAQRYRVEPAGDGYFYIVNVGSDKVLDVAAGVASSGTNVQQYEKNGTAAQKWQIVSSEDNVGFYVVSALSSDRQTLVMDVAGGSLSNFGNVQIYELNETKAQRFSFASVQRTVADGVYVLTSSLSSNLALDVYAGSVDNGANVQVYAANRTAAQKFEVSFDDKTGYYTLLNVGSGKTLDVAGASIASGANVQQYDSNGTSAQKWSICTSDNGYYNVRSACSGLVLDVAGGGVVNGTNVQTWESNGTAAQQWVFDETRILDDGVYVFGSALGTVLDAAGGGETNGTNVQAYDPNGTLAQKYQLAYVSDGYYRIEAIKSGLVLDAVWGTGPNVQLYQSNQSAAQLWKPVPLGGGYYAFANKATGKVLDVAAASSESGANVQLYALNGTSAQKWKLIGTELLHEGLYAIASSANPAYVLDVVNGSTSDGALLQLYQDNGTAAQKFKLSSLGRGYYRIVCLGSNRSLDVKDHALDASTGFGVVQQWASGEGNRAQSWRAEYAGGGLFRFASACGNGNSYLNADLGVVASGTSVGVLGADGTASQKFKLTSVDSTVSYAPYGITLDDMVAYQKAGNKYISDISVEELKSALSPSGSGTEYYQFTDLRLNTGMSGSQLDAYINTSGSSGVLSGKGSVFASAAKSAGLNEAYLVAHTCLESGWGKSRLAKGEYYNGEGYWYTGKDGNRYWAALPGYPAGTYYNLFGIGAYDSDPHKFGVEAAIKNGWNSVDSAIYGAAEWIAGNYVYAVSYAQPTLYDMKWDVARSNATKKYGWHQYATDVQWAKKIARLIGSCYSVAGVSSPDVRYVVPQYA